MFSPVIIYGLLPGLSFISSGVAQPVNTSEFVMTHTALDHFSHAEGDLSPFDVDVKYIGYDAPTRSWLAGLNPASGANDKEKAKILTEAAYAKPFNESDPDMTADVKALLAAIAGNATAHRKRDGSSFSISAAHSIIWGPCAGILSCLSGTTCAFSMDIGKAPRSHCVSQGDSNCCISWSSSSVRVGFLSSAWTTCNDEVAAQAKDKVSCEGHGSSAQGGDVCLSNRATGCT